MIRLNLLGVVLISLFSSAATAAVYRWVDTEGHVHYTDKPVADSEVVNVHTGQPRGAQPLPGSSPTPDSDLTPEQMAQRKSDCEQKKKQYDSYKTASKIIETDSIGRQHEYTEDEQKVLVQKAQQAMQETCGAAGVTAASSEQR